MADNQLDPGRREAFEKIGPQQLHLRLARNEYAPDYARDAERWLVEQEAKADAVERRRFRTLRCWAAIAGITGALAATAAWWSIIKQWIR
jgi:hypothetical protein